nr:hypothetical protein [Tanacetum cinerariifolium]
MYEEKSIRVLINSSKSFNDLSVEMKRSRQDKDKDEGPSAGSEQGLKKRKTSKDAEPIT